MELVSGGWGDCLSCTINKLSLFPMALFSLYRWSGWSCRSSCATSGSTCDAFPAFVCRLCCCCLCFCLGLELGNSLQKLKKQKMVGSHLDCFNQFKMFVDINPLNPAGRFSGLRKQGPKNPAGRFSGICYGVSKTRRAFKPAHVRLIIKWFVYTGRYQATLRSQVESSSLFSFRTICNLLTGFCTRYTNLRRKYGGDTQCMWRYRYSLHVMDNVEE